MIDKFWFSRAVNVMVVSHERTEWRPAFYTQGFIHTMGVAFPFKDECDKFIRELLIPGSVLLDDIPYA